jgi:hypothetical protein
MTNNTKRTVVAITVALTVAALVAPASASALTPLRQRTSGLSAAASATVGPLAAQSGAVRAGMSPEQAQQLRERVATALQRRGRAFENVARMLERHQERVMKLTDRAEDAGADVSQVRTMIEESKRLLTKARGEAAKAAEMFRGVPDADDRREAFSEARDQARLSVRTLKQSRIKLREAARELREVVRDLIPAESGDTG